MILLSAVAVLSLALPGAVKAADAWITSGERRVQLIELYSSEGCSSCPPAERWISKLTTAPGLWDRFVPINLHVDYWDRLGWPDRFASAEFTRRQRDYVEAGKIGNPYTPCFLVGGREWRGFFAGERDAPEGKDGRVGVLKLRVSGERVEVLFDPVVTVGDPLELHAAVLGFDQSTEVRAGENRGRTLVQNFVALGHRVARSKVEEGIHRGSLPLPLARDAWPARAALVGWVSRGGDPSPLQAAGGVVEGATSR